MYNNIKLHSKTRKMIFTGTLSTDAIKFVVYKVNNDFKTFFYFIVLNVGAVTKTKGKFVLSTIRID